MILNKIVITLTFIMIAGGDSENLDFNPINQAKTLEKFCRQTCEAERYDENTCLMNNCTCSYTNTNNIDVYFSNSPNLKPPTLACKESEKVVLTWNVQNHFTYWLEVLNEGERTKFTAMTKCGSYTVNHLKPGENYQVRLGAISSIGNVSAVSDLIRFKTRQKNWTPKAVSKFILQHRKLQESNYGAIVKWVPANDLPCRYHLVWFKENSIDVPGENEILAPFDSFNTTITNLEFEGNYTVYIRATTSIGESTTQESPKVSLQISIPSCLESYKSLTKCPPPKPTNLSVVETIIESHKEEFIYSINLMWSRPELQPDYYIADFRNIIPVTQDSLQLNISGDQTSAVFQDVKLGVYYQVSLTAWSSAGASKPIVEHRNVVTSTNTTNPTQKFHVLETIFIITGPLVAIFGLITILIVLNNCRNKRIRLEQHKYFTELQQKSPENLDCAGVDLITESSIDKWELPFNQLILQTALGEGAFGIVRRGYLVQNDGDKREVAIKMLKDAPTIEEIRQFTYEIEIMKSVRQHPYIVSLIGCVTHGRAEGPLLVVEYCSRGDLQTYLRTAWENLSNSQQGTWKSDEESDSSIQNFTNLTYGIQDEQLCSEFLVEPKHLLAIARQVALGMEHLAKMKVVHRDLAARNVLVCQDHSVKVSDFGLSRDVYQNNVYCKSGGGKLPIRWMALESLTHQRSTIQSDVWSFGILLWEIVTLGGIPYAGINYTELLPLLKQGHRLERPANCGSELYEIMQSCWRASPKDRPTFTTLCQQLEDLLESVSNYLRLDIVNGHSSTKPALHHLETTSLERYVRPINLH